MKADVVLLPRDLALAAFFGLTLGVGLALLMEHLDDSIHALEDLDALFIALLDTTMNINNITYLKVRSFFLQAFFLNRIELFRFH